MQKLNGSNTSFGKFFSIMALPDVMKGGTTYMGISPRKAGPHKHRPGVNNHLCYGANKTCGSICKALLGGMVGNKHGSHIGKQVCIWQDKE